MKNLKRTLAAIVALVMIFSFSGISTFAYSDVTEGSSVSEAVGILSNLGIFQGFEDGTFRPSDTVTRAQMAAIVCRMLGYEEQAQSSGGYTDFYDVDGSHWASGYINVAKSLNIINGFPGGYFAPEDKVTYEQAVKMIVCALNYEIVAQGKGGYPNGYLSVASSEGITKSSGGRVGTEAARATLAMLVYNSLEVRLLDQSTWTTDGSDEFSKSDETILSQYLGVQKWEGVVTESPLTDYASGYSADEDPMITIEGFYREYRNGVFEKIEEDEIKTADCSLVNADNLLGKKVVAYIGEDEDDETGNVMVYAISEKTNSNTVVSISSTQLVDEEDREWNTKGQLSYRKVGSSKVYDIDFDKDVEFLVNYENESSLDENSSTFDVVKYIEEGGMIELISNDNDSDAEYVIIQAFSAEAVIEEVDEEDGIYSFRLYNGDLEEIDTEDEDALAIVYKDGMLGTVEDLESGDTVSTVEIGSDVRLLYVSSESVTGSVSSYDNETVTIKSNDYEISPFFGKSTSSLKDEEGIFFINVNGQIAYSDSDSVSSGNYGFILAVDYEKGISDGYVAQVAMYDGSIVEYELSSKVKFYDKNGNQLYSGESEVASYLAYLADGNTDINNTTSYTTVKNAKNMLFKITVKNDTISKIKTPEGDSYSNYLDSNTKRYDEETMSYGAVEFDEGTVVFALDASYSSTSNSKVRDEDVRIGKVSRFFADGDDNYHFVALDEDDGIYGAVIGFNLSTSVSEDNDAIIITEKRSVTYNDDEAVKISGLQAGREVSYTIYDDDSSYSWGDDPEKLEKGDVILVSSPSSSNVVSDFKLLYKASRYGIGSVSSKALYGDSSDDIYNAVGYLKKDKTTNSKFYIDTDITNHGGTFAEENDGITIKASANYTLVDYSESTKNPEIIKKNASSAIFSSSSRYDSYVFVRVYDDVVREVVVYRFAAESSTRSSVETPVITFGDDSKVEIECGTSGASIYYTTDGSTPSKSSNLYSQPFAVSESTTVKAIAYKSGYDTSSVATKECTLKVEKPVISLDGNVATISCATEGAEIYYTFGDSVPSKENGTKYESPVTIPDSNTINAIALKENWISSSVVSKSYTAQASEPEITLSGSTFSISCDTTGADIFYTLNGSTPSKENGTKYETPVTLKENASIKAVAVKENYDDSKIVSVGFTAQVEEPEVKISGSTLTIKCATENAEIYYTLDGSTPSEAANKYSAPVELKAPATVKAIAVKQGCKNSDVDSAVYNPQVKKPVVKITGDKLTISCATEDAEIYYTLDGSAPTKASTKYAGEVALTKAAVVKAIAVKEGYENSDADSASYMPQVENPVIKITAKGFEITCKTDGADVYYTVDGTNPTEKSAKYSKAVELSKDATVKAIAIKKDYKDSSVVSEKFTAPVVLKPALKLPETALKPVEKAPLKVSDKLDIKKIEKAELKPLEKAAASKVIEKPVEEKTEAVENK